MRSLTKTEWSFTLSGAVAIILSTAGVLGAFEQIEPWVPVTHAGLANFRAEIVAQLTQSIVPLKQLEILGIEGQLRQLQGQIDALAIERAKPGAPAVLNQVYDRYKTDVQSLEQERKIAWCDKWHIERPSLPCITPEPIVKLPQ